MKVTFDRDFLVSELGLPYSAIEDAVVENDRWSIEHEIVFEHEGKFYKTWYSVGATEMQYESPWEYVNAVACIQVEKKLVQVEQWAPVEDVV